MEASQKEVEEKLKTGKLEGIARDSPMSVTLWLSGFAPEFKYEFCPPLELQNGDWNIGLGCCTESDDFAEDIINVPYEIEVTVEKARFGSIGSSKVLKEIIPKKTSRLTERVTCGLKYSSKNWQNISYHPISIDGAIEAIKIKIVKIPKKKREKKRKNPFREENESATKKICKKKKGPRPFPEVRMEFELSLKTDEQLKINKIDDAMEEMKGKIMDLEDKIDNFEGRKKELVIIAKRKSGKCPTCKQEREA